MGRSSGEIKLIFFFFAFRTPKYAPTTENGYSSTSFLLLCCTVYNVEVIQIAPETLILSILNISLNFIKPTHSEVQENEESDPRPPPATWVLVVWLEKRWSQTLRKAQP